MCTWNYCPSLRTARVAKSAFIVLPTLFARHWRLPEGCFPSGSCPHQHHAPLFAAVARTSTTVAAAAANPPPPASWKSGSTGQLSCHDHHLTPDSEPLPLSVSSTNRLINVLVSGGDVHAARRLFDAMPKRTLVSWNSMLAAYSKRRGHLAEALRLFADMPCPDIVSFNTMLSCYFRNANVDGARRFFREMPVKDCVSWNTMITGLSGHGVMEEAQTLFSTMPSRNLVSWNAMITGFMRVGDLHMAEEYFNRAPEAKSFDLEQCSFGLQQFVSVRIGKTDSSIRL